MNPTKHVTKRGKVRKRLPAGSSIQDRLLWRRNINPAGCWVWTGAIKGDSGYGCIMIEKKLRYTHRVAWTEFVGPIPDGFEVDHLCRNRACFNPEHLEPVTPVINVRRGMSPGAVAIRTGRCKHGHDRSIWGVTYGKRVHCRLCNIAWQRAAKLLTFDEQMARKNVGLPVVDLSRLFRSAKKLRDLDLGPDGLAALLAGDEVAA